MLKFAVLNDIHLADNPPLGRVPGYTDQIFNKLLGVADIMREQKADTLILTGDLFHLKRPDRVSHALVNRIIDLFENEFATSVYICPGNHDLTESGIASLSRQPLDSLFVSGVARPLIKSEYFHAAHTGTSHATCFIGRHYDTDGDLDPNYYPVTQEEEKFFKGTGSKVLVMVAHGSIVPPGANPIYPHINVDDIPWSEGKLTPDLLLCGHLHEDWGIHRVPNGPIYVNLGSFGRPSRNQVGTDTRNFLMVTVDDDQTLQLEQIPIPHMLPSSEVFIEKAEASDDSALSMFAETLAESIVLEETPIDEALSTLGEMPPEVLRRLKKYLEDAGL